MVELFEVIRQHARWVEVSIRGLAGRHTVHRRFMRAAGLDD